MSAAMIDRALLGLASAIVLAFVIGGAAVRAEMDAERAAAIELALLEEDRSVCARLQAPPGSDRFSACAIELDQVRQNAQARRAALEFDLP